MDAYGLLVAAIGFILLCIIETREEDVSMGRYVIELVGSIVAIAVGLIVTIIY